jgi:hypothetical protein
LIHPPFWNWKNCFIKVIFLVKKLFFEELSFWKCHHFFRWIKPPFKFFSLATKSKTCTKLSHMAIRYWTFWIFEKSLSRTSVFFSTFAVLLWIRISLQHFVITRHIYPIYRLTHFFFLSPSRWSNQNSPRLQSKSL